MIINIFVFHAGDEEQAKTNIVQNDEQKHLFDIWEENFLI